MINKLILAGALAALVIQPVQAQRQTAESSKEAKAGESVQFGDGLAVKALESKKSPFATLKLKGEPVIVVLELDAGKKGATLSYNLSTDFKSSDLYLIVGGRKHAPRAVMEDFPSWGADNDKEVEVLDSKSTDTGVSIKFEGKGSIYLLFDLPTAQSKTPKKLSINLRTIEPKEGRHSVVLNL